MNCTHKASDLFVHRCTGPQQGGAVHALVIGTSKYETNGSIRPRRKGRLRDIPGAALGAAQFAKWLADKFTDPADLPLLTVRLLLAPVQGERAAIDGHGVYLDATRDNVSSALEDWYFDCDSHPSNVAVLYVAGHGVVEATTGDALSVFLSRFNFVQDRYSQSLSMLRIDDAMQFCRAHANIIVHDCCASREKDVPSEAGAGLEPEKDRGGDRRKYRLSIAAARVGDRAFALGAERGTLLSDSLMPLLTTAGEVVVDRFAITRHRLEDELQAAIADRLRDRKGRQQEPRVSGDHPYRGIHRPTPPPQFKIAFTPLPANAPIEFSVQEFGSGQPLHGGVLAVSTPQPPVPLAAGEYLLESRAESSISWRKDRLIVDRDRECVVSGVPE